jgi:hypothetical protein
MNVEELLQRNCHTGPDRNDLGKPFLVEASGQPWTIATDGFMMFAAKGTVGEPQTASAGSSLADLPKIVERATAARAVELSTASLLAVAGHPLRDFYSTCITCRGTGDACSCGECECPDCEGGQRYSRTPVRKGFICERLCDLNRVACLLTGVDGPVFTEGREQWSDPARPLYFSGDGWCGVVMPLPPEHESGADLAAYPRWVPSTSTGAGQ